MSYRQLKLYPSPELMVTCQPVEEIDDDIQELAKDMEALVYKYAARGLAAPQVGECIRMFTMMIKDEAVTLINPFLVLSSGNIFRAPESCLSIPSVNVVLKCRNDLISVKYTSTEGEEVTSTLMSAEAVAFQHELDHLDGITLFTRMGAAKQAAKKNAYLKRVKKWKKAKTKQFLEVFDVA